MALGLWVLFFTLLHISEPLQYGTVTGALVLQWRGPIKDPRQKVCGL